MKKLFLCLIAVSVSLIANDDFVKREDLAQYKGADYANVVCVERNLSLEEAFEIAEENPDIDYFMYVKGGQMVLELPEDYAYDPETDPFGLITETRYIYDSGMDAYGYCRVFSRGDAVFFTNQGMWLGDAPGLADVYVKKAN